MPETGVHVETLNLLAERAPLVLALHRHTLPPAGLSRHGFTGPWLQVEFDDGSVYLTPHEARELAAKLTKLADKDLP